MIAAWDKDTLPSLDVGPKPVVWPFPREVPQLKNQDLHLWCAAMDDFRQEKPSLEALLSREELRRASTFRFRAHRDSYVIRHGILRSLLGRYLGRWGADINFDYGPAGKPEIKDGGATGDLHFNDSHSCTLVVCAFTRAGRIGVDVECLNPIQGLEDIANHFFSSREKEIFLSLPTDLRMEAFYTAWTRKEALLKATGEGLRQGMAQVEALVDTRRDGATTGLRSESLSSWQWVSARPAEGYLATVAYGQANLTVGLFRATQGLLA